MADSIGNTVPGSRPDATLGGAGEINSATRTAGDSLGLSPEQHKVMADHLVKSGVLTAAQANDALTQSLLDAGAITPEQAAEARKTGVAARLASATSGPGSLAPEVRDYLVSQGMTPPRPEEYQLPPVSDGEALDVQGDRYCRNWLSAAGFSANNGSYLAAQLDKAGQQYEAMNPAQQEIYARTERDRVMRALGPNANQRLELARQLVNELEEHQPGLKDLLEMGPGHSANVIMAFVNQAEILNSRF